MNYRTVVLHAEEDLLISGTKVIPIRVKDPITSLIFMLRITLGAGKRLLPEPDVISKLEIVDGSDVIMSLSGTEIVALNFYEGHKLVNGLASNLASATRTFRISIPFGRFLRDPLLAFDPTKFLNPQLKITYDVTAVQALATNLFVTVIAQCFDEKVISPIGYLRMTEYHSYVGAATTYEYIDLPVDLDIRKLYLQAKNFGIATPSNLNAVKLSEDNDKRIPFDLETEQWGFKCSEEFGAVDQLYYATCGGRVNEPFFGAPTDNEVHGAVNTSGIRALQSAWNAGGGYAVASATITDIAQGLLSGYLPYGVFCYPFGDQMDIDDWYKLAGKVENLRFRIRSGAAGADVTFNTILQQLRRY